MRRMSSRRPGVPGPVVSALQRTEVPPSMRYVPLPSPFGGSDPQGCSLGLSKRGQPLVVCPGAGVDGASLL